MTDSFCTTDLPLPPAPDIRPNLDLGVVGNGAFAVLIDQDATVVWGCFPRFDSDPVFCSLLMGGKENGHGYFAIKLMDHIRSEQRYIKNTAVLETTLFDSKGGAVQITDFAPRHSHYGRTFHPMMLIRRIKCVSGLPQIVVQMRPSFDQGEKAAARRLGSNHIRFETKEQDLRLTSDSSANLIFREIPFVLQGDLTLVLGPDEPLAESPAQVGEKLYAQTVSYWQYWCRHLALPADWQDVVIRAAITLKLCSYEETGGIVAALTTSIPEYQGSGRNWDYRYCWLRDAFFVVQALNRLGAIESMERYVSYVKNIVVSSAGGQVQPLYGISYEKELPESVAAPLPGYRQGNGPVRFGNAAFRQVQNDSYGSIILALTQSFFDERLDHAGDQQLFTLLENLGEQAYALWNKPDAGLWEYRTRADVHTHSAAMCWAACDRLQKIAAKLRRQSVSDRWGLRAREIREGILAQAWNEERQTFSSTFGGSDVDASLLLLPEIGLVPATDLRFLKTLNAIEKDLRRGNTLYRYGHADDFGLPETSFNICTLWFAQTLKRVGRDEEAKEVFEGILKRCNPLGLLSEGSHAETGEAWGNFPQTYSMVGLIQVALLLSKPWDNVV